ncbi:MAG: helix-turn-helix domain-containing protein [Nitrospirota bacterium]
MHKKLERLLLEAGLSEAEVKIYLELLKQPSQSKWELVSRTGLDKNQVYRAFDSLNALRMVKKDENGIEPRSLDSLVGTLELSQKKTQNIVEQMKQFSPFLKIPAEAVEDFQVLDSHDEIMNKFFMMAELNYNICLDFGDLERFIPIVLKDVEQMFKFRMKRYLKSSKNIALCTNNGPFTSCMMRKNDMEKYQSDVHILNINFKDKWLIFSDTGNQVMFNYFTDKNKISSVLVNSKIVADAQRSQFDHFKNNLHQFS